MTTRTRAVQLTWWLAIGILLPACGAITANAPATTSTNPNGITITGTFTLPTGTLADLGAGTAAVRKAAGGASHKAATTVSLSETAVAVGTCELLDSTFAVLDTAATQADGTFAFDVPHLAALRDTTNTDDAATLCFHLRCAVATPDGDPITEVASHCLDRATTETALLDADPATAPLADLPVSNASSVTSVLAYADTAFNPLTATAATPPPALAAPTQYLPALDAAVTIAATAGDATATAQTVDGSLAFLLAATAALNDGTPLADGTAPAAAIAQLFTADATTAAATLDVLAAALQNTDGLGHTTATTLRAVTATTEDVTAAVGLLAAHPNFAAAPRTTTALLVGGLILGSTPTALLQMVATDTSIGTLVTFATTAATAAAPTSTTAATQATHLSALFEPALVLAAARNPAAAQAMTAMLTEVFAAPRVTTATVTALGSGLTAQAANPAFWGTLATDTTADATAITRLVAFVDQAHAANVVDTNAADGTTLDWGQLFTAVDLQTDWAAMDAATFTAQTSDWIEQSTLLFNTASCTYAGGNFCGGLNAGGSCACDDDCVPRGDCCPDKVATCGANTWATFLTTWQVDVKDTTLWSTTFAPATDADSDGDGVADAQDNCGWWWNPDQADADGNGFGDACSDTDHDGAFDDWDNCPTTWNPDQANTDYWADSAGDACDLDADGDGTPRTADNCPGLYNPDQTDSDDDGRGDACDGKDTDGDGWLDSWDNCPRVDNPDQMNTDYWADADGDACDADDDGDAVADTHDNCPVYWNADQTDTDDDGEGDWCDGSDSDQDGWLDLYDNCATAPNLDQADSNWDGEGDACDSDDDGDGVADASDNCRLAWNLEQTDSDGNGRGDACDGTDTDGDGWIDVSDNCDTVKNPDQLDSNWDGEGDACDSDDDGDGVADATDTCRLAWNADQADADGNGLGDACDGTDTDGDGWIDSADNCDTVSNLDQVNTDYWADAAGDACDDDDDGDDVADSHDTCAGYYNPDQADSDGNGQGDACDGTDADFDGVMDSVDNCPYLPNPDQFDTDSDGAGNYCDLDGLTMLADGPDDLPAADFDGDGVPDSTDNCLGTLNADQADSDSDGQGDACDDADNNDTDADGVADTSDNCLGLSNADQADTDGDGQGDACDALNDADDDFSDDTTDNCLTLSNPDQADTDGDGQGDACDALNDADGDFIDDTTDNCLTLSNADQADTDSDGQGDACDDLTDQDADGIADDIDNCPLTVNVDQSDLDSDFFGDLCDTDDDGDDVSDDTDNCPTLSNADQIDVDTDTIGDACDDLVDSDADGVANATDNCPLTTNTDQADDDSDGYGNACDSDGDDFADPTPISALPFTETRDDTITNTTETNEPIECNGAPISNTVWYSYTASSDTFIQVDFRNSNFDTVVAVYTGTDLDDLSAVTCNDDFFDVHASVTLPVTSGTTYYIQAGAYGGDTGTDLTIDVTEVDAPPANDDFADAIPLTEVDLPYSPAPFSTTGADKEPDEADDCAWSANTVWYSFTPTVDTVVNIDATASDFNVAATVYTGATLGTLGEESCEYNTIVQFTATADTTYYIRFGGLNATGGSSLNFTLSEVLPPTNDDFASAQAIGALPYSDTQTTSLAATTEGSESTTCSGQDLANTVWYSYTAGSDTYLNLDTRSSNFDTAVAVYTGTDLASLSLVACDNDNFVEERGAVTIPVSNGTTYYIQVAGNWGETGTDLTLDVTEVDAPPANDDFADAIPLTEVDLPYSPAPFSTTGADKEADEADDCAWSANTVWYSFTPTVDTVVNIDATDSDFNVAATVYTGATLDTLGEESCEYNTIVQFTATADTTYYIRFGGLNATGGSSLNFTLSGL
ncbi:MAG: thrombospondin type 3 repeat-containing protein [Deltaproteobacteria bacterium]|nr:thrombospondin type 3 repeat-containing protein [Deltaproteobacteria bacterium]